MTPYNHAESLLKSGASFDQVVATLTATGLDPSDAKVATRAARSKVPCRAVEAAHEAPAPKPRDGLHGLPLAAAVALSVLGVVAIIQLAMTAGLILFVSDDAGVLRLLESAVRPLVLLAGAVLLWRRKRAARYVLLAWCGLGVVACLGVVTLEAAGFHFRFAFGATTAGFDTSGFLFYACWAAYLAWSKQLRVALSR